MPHYELIVRAPPGADIDALTSETGLRCTVVGHAARLDGDLVDRAALYGVLERVFRLGLDLVALQRRSPSHAT